MSEKEAKNTGEILKFGNSVSIDTGARLKEYDNGTAKAYAAYDERNRAKKYIAMVCEAVDMPRLSGFIPYKALIEQSFPLLVAHGTRRWPLDGRYKFILLYNHNMARPLGREGELVETSWRNPDVVEFLVQPMSRMFRELEDKSFVHGSIRVSNIFYDARGENFPIILGDCLATQPDCAQPAAYLTAERALADPMGRGVGTLKDDIYAFGVTLVKYLKKTNDLEAMSDEELIENKMRNGSYATLIGKDRFQANFQEFLKGVLHDNPNDRWGNEEIATWLDGGRPANVSTGKGKKSGQPITFAGKKYYFSEVLAKELHKSPNEAFSLYESGALEKWVEKSIGSEVLTTRYKAMAARIDAMGSRKNDHHKVAALLGISLNPKLPIFYKGKSFTLDGFGNLMAIQAYEEGDMSYYLEVLRSNMLDEIVSNSDRQGPEIVSLQKFLEKCRAMTKQQRLGDGIEKAIYSLCSDAPCYSPLIKDYFVYNAKGLLWALERVSQQGGQIALYVDTHIAAYFNVRDTNLMDKYLYDLNSREKSSQIAGNLHFLANIQKRSQIKAVDAICQVFLEALSDVYKIYKNKKVRDTVKKGVEAAAKSGDLSEMSALLSNYDAMAKDQKAFLLARAEYKMLQKEYDTYDKKMANKASYGMVDGHRAAAIFSWMAAILMMSFVIVLHLGGKHLF